MKTFKKSLSLFLCVCLFASIAVVAAFPASANYGDEQRRPLVTDYVKDVETQTFYFYMPESWKNDLNDTYDGKSLDSCKAGIYWWEGTANCNDVASELGLSNAWPGYVIPDTDPSNPNVYVVKVPKDVYQIIFNNTVDGGSDQSHPDYVKAIQTVNIGTEFYSPGEDGYDFYPEGNDGFDGMIYVCNPNAIEKNEFSGKETYKGVWFYYYGNGEYGVNKERVEGQVYSNGVFPPYGLQIDENVEVEVGSVADIACNDNSATVVVEDPSVAEVIKDETLGTFSVKGLKVGTTRISFTVVKEKKDPDTGEVTKTPETKYCTVTVKAKPAPVPPVVTKKKNPITVTVAAQKKLTVKLKKGKSKTTKKTTLTALTVKNNKAGKVTYKVAKKDAKKVLTLKNNKVVVKKGAKKGTYTIKVTVSTKATTKYKAFSTTKTIKVKVTK